MNFKEALKRVIKICPKEKDASLFRAVRLIAGTTGLSRVFTSDGTCMISVPVDKPLPDAIITTKGLASAVKDTGSLGLVENHDGSLTLAGSSGTYAVTKSDNVDYFPSPPVTPLEFTMLTWKYVKKVLHAAAKDKQDNTLAVIHFTTSHVEAFDQVRLARVEMDGTCKGLVPAKLFKYWPSGKVGVAFNEHHAFFQIGEELRIANLVKMEYPDTTKLAVNGKEGGSVFVQTEKIVEGVKRATEISPLNLVMLVIEAGTLKVKACDANGAINTFEAAITMNHYQGSPGQATVDGKLFQQALKQCVTPVVKLTSGDSVDPVRIESSNFVEWIWQRYWE